MKVPEEPGAAVALLVVFVIVSFVFLLCLAKGCLSERQQTGVWVIFTVLFFSVCSVLVRGTRASNAPAPIDTKGVRR